MSELKDSWKQTGVGLGHAFRDLSKTLIKTGKKGVDKAVEWAERDNAPEQQTAQQPEAQPAPQQDADQQ